MAAMEPAALPETGQDALQELRASFAIFDSWEDRYRFLIELGKDVAPLPPAQRIEANLVRGCQSQVWLVPDYDDASDRLALAIDSDAHIVRGLIAIVLAAYQRRSPEDILGFDIEGLFDELALLSHLSPGRGNGLRAMVAKIRRLAAACRQPSQETPQTGLR